MSSTQEVEMEFKLKNYGDDLNLYYVAVTRARSILKLPEAYWLFMELIDQVNEGELPLDSKFTLEEWNGLKTLFATFEDN